MQDRVPLRERKQLQARERIVVAAYELFRERGFAAVSVSDIVDRAEVGRTSFFRYFGDKQEVVFARHQEILDTISKVHDQRPMQPPADLVEAMAQLREVVIALCVQVTDDPESFTMHAEIVAGNADLRARGAVKLQHLAQLLGDILVARGGDHTMAVLASQLALACYQAALTSSGGDPGTLVAMTESMFDRLLRLGNHDLI